MPYLCLIEPDEKSATQISQIVEPLCKEKSYQFLKSANVAELDELIKAANKPDEPIALLIVAIELNSPKIELQIKALSEKYKCGIIVAAYEDSHVSGNLIANLQVENILYKPIDAAIGFEHIRFAVSKDDFTKTTAVHSLGEKCEVEKIRRFELLAISDFGFICIGHSKMEVGQFYKFYHPYFNYGLKQSVWARLVSQSEEQMCFIYCAPTLNVTNVLRKRVSESKNKVKSVSWQGFKRDQTKDTLTVHVALTDEEEKKKLLDYFQRKFPKIKVVDWKPNPKEPKVDSHFVIVDQAWTKKNIEQFFNKPPLIFAVAPVPVNRKGLQAVLDIETVRVQYPLDRNYLGKVITTYFQETEELDPSITTWISSEQKILNSILIEVTQLSEAAFVYNRTPILARGKIQEFALPDDDETELKPILAKTQFASEKAGEGQLYTHQIVFFGIRDVSLKKLRLWMRLRHIQAQQKS